MVAQAQAVSVSLKDLKDGMYYSTLTLMIAPLS